MDNKKLATLLASLLFVYFLGIQVVSLAIVVIVCTLSGISFALHKMPLKFDKIHDNQITTTSHPLNIYSLTLKSNVQQNLPENYFQSRSLISKNVDNVLEEIIDLIIRDYVIFWYRDIVQKDDILFKQQLK